MLQAVVVAFIVLIVGSVLIVAIARVREAANRTQCANNLKQVGLAIHNYFDTYRYLPPAGNPKSDQLAEHRLSWAFSIYPFLESGPKLGDENSGWDSEKNRILPLAFTFKCYECPSHPSIAPTSKFIPTNYLGIAGLGIDAATLPLDDPNAGFFGYERKLQWEDIKRGPSNTFAVVETAWASGAWTAAPNAIRGLDPAGSPYIGVSQQFGGNHLGGVNVLFADGSVRFLESGFDPQEFERMATITGTSSDSP